MKYALSLEEMKKQTFYNCIRQSDYNADGYLDGLEVVSENYKTVFEKYKNIPGALFLIDPPYLSTDTSTYSKESYWKLKDYLDVLNVLKDVNYIYFTSDKSSIVELTEWIEANPDTGNPFRDAVRRDAYGGTGYNSSYTDIMLTKIA